MLKLLSIPTTSKHIGCVLKKAEELKLRVSFEERGSVEIAFIEYCNELKEYVYSLEPFGDEVLVVKRRGKNPVSFS